MSVDKKSSSEAGKVIKKKVTSKDIEIWDVAGLPCHIGFSSRPSDTFKRLEEKRKVRHECVIRKFWNGLNEINANAEKNVRISSTNFKAEANYFEKELEKLMESCDKSEIVSWNASDFQQIQAKANQIKRQHQNCVDELYEELNKFENERSKRNEKLFSLTCEEFRKVGYLLPYQIQKFAEQEMLKINQLCLSNRRCYSDLKLTLTLVTEETYKSFNEKIFCIQERWIRKKVLEALVTVQKKAEDELVSVVPILCTRLELKGFELEVEPLPDGIYNGCKLKQWSDNVVKVANIIECHGKNIIKLYRDALSAVFHHFDNEVKEVMKEIMSVENLDIEERILKPIRFEAQAEQAKEIEDLETIWQDNLHEINGTLKIVTNFLQEAGNLWKRHEKRVCETKKLILKALEKEEENNEDILQDLEVKLNIGLDILRQESDKSKLEKSHEAVVAILNSIKEKYEGIYLNQVDIIEDFYKMMDSEAEVLSAEIKEFVYVLHEAETEKITSDQRESFSAEKFIYREIQKCVQQIKTLKSWKNGVWTALENFSLKTKEYLKPKAETWIAQKIENLAEKMTTKMEIFQKRFDRIKIEFFEKRWNEIDFHEEIYNDHKEGVSFALNKLKENLSILTKNEMTTLMELQLSLAKIQEMALTENRPAAVKAIETKLKRKKVEFEEKLKSHIDIYKADCEMRMANVSRANLAFMKSIKLFHEGGNYSVEEGKNYVSELEMIDREIREEEKNIMKEVEKNESELMKKSSEVFNPPIVLLTSLYEETSFHRDNRETIGELNETMTSLVESLRSDLDLLQDRTDCMNRIIADRNDLLKKSDFQFWSVLIPLLYKNVSNLFYPMIYRLTPVSSEEGDASVEGEEDEFPYFGDTKFSTKATISETPTFRSAKTKDNFLCINYQKEVFNAEDPPENDGTFMAVVSNVLWAELDRMQEAACNFYKKLEGREIFREDLLRPTYESFASKMVPLINSCNQQCERIWLQTILDFLPIVGRIKSAANRFFQRLLDEYEETILVTLDNYEENFEVSLRSQISRNTKAFDALDDKLLPLHGYPKNKPLLDDLEEEVVRKTAGLGIEWNSTIEKYKNRLNCFRIHHLKERREILEIQSMYLKLREKIFLESFGNNLLDAITEYADRGGFRTKKVSKEETESEANLKGFKFESIPMNYPTVSDYMNSLKILIEIERSKVKEPPPGHGSHRISDSSWSSQAQKMDVLLEPLDFIVGVNKLIERIEKRMRNMNNLASSKANVHEEALFKWLNLWKFNVKKVKKLYTVKYEEKPKEEVTFLRSENGSNIEA